MNMTDLQARLFAVPLVMIGGAIFGHAQFRGIDSEVCFFLAVIPFVGGGILFAWDVMKSLKLIPGDTPNSNDNT